MCLNPQNQRSESKPKKCKSVVFPIHQHSHQLGNHHWHPAPYWHRAFHPPLLLILIERLLYKDIPILSVPRSREQIYYSQVKRCLTIRYWKCWHGCLHRKQHFWSDVSINFQNKWQGRVDFFIFRLNETVWKIKEGGNYILQKGLTRASHIATVWIREREVQLNSRTQIQFPKQPPRASHVHTLIYGAAIFSQADAQAKGFLLPSSSKWIAREIWQGFTITFLTPMHEAKQN